MAEYQKKPVVIEARQWDEKVLLKPLARWCGGFISADQAGPYISIPTLEGRIYAREGDWIIRGVKGEFYPCKPDIFNATYQKPASRQPWLPPEDVETLRVIAAELADGVLGDGFHGPATTSCNRIAKEQSDKLRAIIEKVQKC